MSSNRHDNTISRKMLKNDMNEAYAKMNEAYAKWEKTSCLNCFAKRAAWQAYKREEKLYLEFNQVLFQKSKDSASSPRRSIHRSVASSPPVKLLRRNLEDAFPALDNPWACPDEGGSIISDSSLGSRSQTSGNKSKEDKSSLKEKVGNHYGSRKNPKNKGEQSKYQCCVSGEWGEGREVVVAHLLPKRSDHVWLDRLEIDDVDNYRNLVLLAYEIENAFDHQQLCFVPQNVHGGTEMVLRILDDKIREKHIHPKSKRTIGEYHGEPMKFNFLLNPGLKRPFSSVLSLHTLKSYELAKKKGWVPEDNETPPKFQYNSVSPLKGDIMTLIKENHELDSSIVSEVSLDGLDEIPKSSTSPTMEAQPGARASKAH